MTTASGQLPTASELLQSPSDPRRNCSSLIFMTRTEALVFPKIPRELSAPLRDGFFKGELRVLGNAGEPQPMRLY